MYTTRGLMVIRTSNTALCVIKPNPTVGRIMRQKRILHNWDEICDHARSIYSHEEYIKRMIDSVPTM